MLEPLIALGVRPHLTLKTLGDEEIEDGKQVSKPHLKELGLFSSYRPGLRTGELSSKGNSAVVQRQS